MLSQIKIHVNDVRAENKAFKRMIGRLGDERDELSSLRRRLDSEITRRRSIDSRMSQAGSKLSDIQTRVQALYNFIEYGMDAYIRADDKARDHPFEKKKKKSIWDKIGGAINAATDGVTGFVEGVAEAVIGTVEGIFNMIAHPIQTIQGLVYVVTHPLDVAVGIWTAVSESWNNDVVNGDAQSRGKWIGRMIGEVALAAVGTKGVDKIGKLAKGSKIVQEAAGVRIVPGALRGRVPGGNWKPSTQGKLEFEGIPLHLPKEQSVKPPSINRPNADIRKHVLENNEKSKTARESSNFDEYLRKEKELLTEIVKKEVLERKGKGVPEINPKYATAIDNKVTIKEQVELPTWLKETYTDGLYRTVITNESITLYRTFGGKAGEGGAFATTVPAANRIGSKIDSALLPEWKNSRQYEAVIEIPKGTELNIGKVEQQMTQTGTVLKGGGDQILLPQNWPNEWIKEIREVPSR